MWKRSEVPTRSLRVVTKTITWKRIPNKVSQSLDQKLTWKRSPNKVSQSRDRKNYVKTRHWWEAEVSEDLTKKVTWNEVLTVVYSLWGCFRKQFRENDVLMADDSLWRGLYKVLESVEKISWNFQPGISGSFMKVRQTKTLMVSRKKSAYYFTQRDW